MLKPLHRIRRAVASVLVALALVVGACATEAAAPTPEIIGPTDLQFPSDTTPPGTSAEPEASAVATLGPDPWSVPFLSRQSSGPIHRKRGCDGIVIQGLTFQDLGPGVEAIRLEKCNGVTIRGNDFARVSQAITILDSTDVRIEWNRYQDILGPHDRDPNLHRANFVQLVNVNHGNIRKNKGKGGDTEDIISLWRSGGTAEDPLIVEDNHFEGTDWVSDSGSGIALGDSTSSHSIARNNILLNPGQAGIFIAGGTDHQIIGNIIYGMQRPNSNVGVYVWNQSEDRPAQTTSSVTTRSSGSRRTANPTHDGMAATAAPSRGGPTTTGTRRSTPRRWRSNSDPSVDDGAVAGTVD